MLMHFVRQINSAARDRLLRMRMRSDFLAKATIFRLRFGGWAQTKQSPQPDHRKKCSQAIGSQWAAVRTKHGNSAEISVAE